MKKNIYRDWTQVSCIAGWFFTIWATMETMVVQPASHVRWLVTPWTVARQASLSLTISQSLPRFMFIVSVILSSHLIFWCPLLLLPLILPSIRDFSNESSMRIRWPKHWCFSFSISPSNEYSGWSSLRLAGLISLLYKGLSGVFSSTTVRRHQLFGILPSLLMVQLSQLLCDHWEGHSLDYTDLCQPSNVSPFLGLS